MTRTTGAVPLVLVADGLEPADRIHVVSADHELGAGMAVRHLLGQGRTRIAHLSGPDDWFDARARVRGWRAALGDAGAEPGELIAGDWSADCGAWVGTDLARRAREDDRSLPDAIFCSNDMMALGLLAALREAEVEVPGRIAVVGYDDVDGAAWFSPSLSTVRQLFDDLGRLSVEVLLQAINGEHGGSHSVAPRLVVRGSSR